MTKFQIFFAGILAALGALIFESLFFLIFPGATALEFFNFDFSFFLAIAAEEAAKFILLWKIFQKSEAEKKENFYLPASLLGSGFAATETALSLSGGGDFNLDLFFSYAGLFLIHIFTGLIYGFFLSRKEKTFRLSFPVFFIFGAAAHFIFNFSVFYEIKPVLIDSFCLIALLLFFLPKIKKAIRIEMS